jgi:hypothetical protein
MVKSDIVGEIRNLKACKGDGQSERYPVNSRIFIKNYVPQRTTA